MKIAINGFGRIGKNFLRAVLADQNAKKRLNVVAINIGPAQIEHVADLFRYDSLLGTYKGSVEQVGNKLVVDGQEILLLACLEPAQAGWSKLQIDWVVDCSGHFTTGDRARLHLDAGAQRVLISAPAHGEDIAIIPGVNQHLYQPDRHHVVSLGSCTTNAFLPMLKVLQDYCSIEQGFMTTVHAYTNTQPILDDDRKDPRKARAGAINIIPAGTGAAGMVGKIIPELEGKIKAVALRVPVPKVSIVDLSFVAKKPITIEGINAAFAKAAQGAMKGIVDITYAPIVSSDCAQTDYSVIVDGSLTDVVGSMGKVFGWYDNEWAYSVRLKDFLLMTEK